MQGTNSSYRHHRDQAKPHQNDNHTHLTTHSRPGPIRNILCCRHVHYNKGQLLNIIGIVLGLLFLLYALRAFNIVAI